MDKAFRIGHLLLRGLGFVFSTFLLICHCILSISFKIIDFVADSF